MAKSDQIIRLFGVIFLLHLSFVAHAQFAEIAPISKQKFIVSGIESNRLRTQNINSIPFWDDFSTGIDTLKWIVKGVSYTETIGINAPSLGMILFDGVDELGKPYSNSIQNQGESDLITSKPFDFNTIPEGQKESLYLSFFWQAGGLGENPDENDQLLLQILTPQKTWFPIWSQSGGKNNNPELFIQEIIKIIPEWQHSEFQFRFVSDGRKSGPFDSWLIDYVYLNTGRSKNNISYPDRSLTQGNNLRLGNYGAFPQAVLEKNSTLIWSTVKNEFLNLENRFRAMEYSITIEDLGTGKKIPVNLNTPFNPVPNSRERRKFQSREISNLETPSKPSNLKITTYLTTGDKSLFTINQGDTTYFDQVNYAQNDTVSTYFPLLDYFAYDNGSADYAAGINQRSGMLAVKYNTPEEVYIKGISINFTNRAQLDLPIDIMIWDQVEKKPLFVKEVLISKPTGEDKFAYYELDTNIRVSGEFFIGFTQFTNDFIHVGLDKTNDQSDKIFYNIAGTWVQNEEVIGSLMIRPHVSLTKPFSESRNPEKQLKIYPNPSDGTLNIEGEFSNPKIFDSFGREIFAEREFTSRGEILTFIRNKPGIYLLNLITEKGSESFRILIK
jgi:hypothetical protein